MPVGTFKCGICGQAISNPPPDPKFCPHARPCGMLMLCGLTSTTCDATKIDTLLSCTHPQLMNGSPLRTWPVYKKIGLKWMPWDLVVDKSKVE